MAIKPLRRAADAAANRHAFKNEATGNEWHARLEWRDGQAGPGTAVVVRISQPDGAELEGSLSFTFTEEKLAQPGFDADAEITTLIEERIERSERILAARSKLAAARGKWGAAGA